MKNKQGQILLITVMVLATIMTVVLSVSFQSVTETQVTKLEEDSQRALAAAEAAVEASLKGGGNVTIGEGSLLNFAGSGITGDATVDRLISNTFMSPIIVKDGSYTFYLRDYDPQTHAFSGSTLNETVTICFDGGTIDPAIEITLIKNNQRVVKYVIDPASRINNATSPAIGDCPLDNNFDYYYQISGTDISTNNTTLMIVRTMYAPTKLVFGRSTDFPSQGNTVSSTAKTQTGVSKKVVLFQSYPQIPAEFFTTSF